MVIQEDEHVIKGERENLLKQTKMSELNIKKNETRMESIMGTWTGLTDVQTNLGKGYALKAEYILHVTCDNMRVNSCTLPSCSEMDNQICIRNVENGFRQKPECQEMEGTLSDWSDVSVYIYASVAVTSNAGLNETRITGNWIGPFNVILAQNKTAIGKTIPNPPMLSSGKVLDQYSSKYVETPNTQYLSIDESSDLISPNDFDVMIGKDAVINTISMQSQINNSTTSLITDFDPYTKYHKTCENGNVKPMLPLMDFIFIEGYDGEEKLVVKLEHRLFVHIIKGTSAYRTMPILTKLLPISGPYCYDDDPKGSYTFDLSFVSTEANSLFVLEHGCVDGLPCTPPALVSFSQSNEDIEPSDLPAPTQLELGTIISLSIALVVVGVLFIISLYLNIRKKGDIDLSYEDNSIPSQVAFEQVEMKEKTDVLEEKDSLKTSLLEKDLSVGKSKNGIMFV